MSKDHTTNRTTSATAGGATIHLAVGASSLDGEQTARVIEERMIAAFHAALAECGASLAAFDRAHTVLTVEHQSYRAATPIRTMAGAYPACSNPDPEEWRAS